MNADVADVAESYHREQLFLPKTLHYGRSDDACIRPMHRYVYKSVNLVDSIAEQVRRFAYANAQLFVLRHTGVHWIFKFAISLPLAVFSPSLSSANAISHSIARGEVNHSTGHWS